MQVELSSLCNLNCKNCYRKLAERTLGHMDMATFREITDKLVKSQKLKKQMFVAGFGESMLNPNFWEMVKYAKARGIQIILPTNATLIDEENIPKLRMVDQVQLSIDSLEKNEELRGWHYNPLKWIDQLKEWRVGVQLNMTINSRNYHELRNFIHFVMKHDVPLYIMFSTPFMKQTPELVEEYKFCIAHYNEIRHMVSQYHLVASIDIGCNTFEKCRYKGQEFAVDWRGFVFPCNDSLLTQETFGHIHDFDSFDQVLDSWDMQEIVKGNLEICNCCKFWDEYTKINYKEELIYDKRLDYYHNLHKGKRCFVLGNSVSFTKEIADLIRNEISIGCNFVAHAIEMYDGFKPTYCCIGDADMILVPESREFIERLGCPIFYPRSILDQVARGTALSYGKPLTIEWTSENLRLLEDKIAVNYLNPSLKKYGPKGNLSLQIRHKDDVSLDLRKGLVESGTVVQQMMAPLAAFLGCNPIYIVGMDGQGHFYKPSTGFIPGPDVIKQWEWYQEKMIEQGQIMYKIGNDFKFPNIDNVSLEMVFGASKNE